MNSHRIRINMISSNWTFRNVTKMMFAEFDFWNIDVCEWKLKWKFDITSIFRTYPQLMWMLLMGFESILLNLSIFMKESVSAHNSILDRKTAKILADATESKRTKLIDWHYPLKSQSFSRCVNQNVENLCRKNILCFRSKGSNAADFWCARTWIHYQNKSTSIQWISQNFRCRKKKRK